MASKTAPKKKSAPRKKPNPTPRSYGEFADEIHELLAADADIAAADPFGERPLGVHHPAHVAREALDLFDAYRYRADFQAVLQAAASVKAPT